MAVFFSPAKINLFLRVLSKRSDGFHEIATLIQAIDLGDLLSFTFAKQDRLICSDPKIPCDASNLVLKAVELFRRKTGLTFFVEVNIQKRIPAEAGFGGGSSNAATTLWALNTLHQHVVSEQELQAWSADLGSDVPFFFSSGTAYCTGRGEQVQSLPPLPSFSFEVIKPNFGLSTPEIYQALDLRTCSQEDPLQLLGDFYKGKPRFINDLEIPALTIRPELTYFLRETQIFMTGSGSGLISIGEGQFKGIARKPCDWY